LTMMFPSEEDEDENIFPDWDNHWDNRVELRYSSVQAKLDTFLF